MILSRTKQKVTLTMSNGSDDNMPTTHNTTESRQHVIDKSDDDEDSQVPIEKKFEDISITSDTDDHNLSIGDGKYISTNKDKCEERSDSDGNDLEKTISSIVTTRWLRKTVGVTRNVIPYTITILKLIKAMIESMIMIQNKNLKAVIIVKIMITVRVYNLKLLMEGCE